MKQLKLSLLPKTWLIDIDGVIFIHNNYLYGEDKPVLGFLEFYKQIDKNDFVLLLSSREEKYKEITEKSLQKYNIKYDKIIFGLPKGERIIINDTKPKGLKTALAINPSRNKFPKIKIVYSESL